MWMDNKRHSTINTVCGQQKWQNRAKRHVWLTFKKKKNFFFFWGIPRIPFQVGNSANSATFPRSRKITGPRLTCSCMSILQLFVFPSNADINTFLFSAATNEDPSVDGSHDTQPSVPHGHTHVAVRRRSVNVQYLTTPRHAAETSVPTQDAYARSVAQGPG